MSKTELVKNIIEDPGMTDGKKTNNITDSGFFFVIHLFIKKKDFL